MPKTFLLSADAPVSAATETPPGPDLLDQPPSERELLRILVIGSRRGVTGTIQTLHRLRFAEVREWSPLMPTPNSGEVMSILTRYIAAD